MDVSGNDFDFENLDNEDVLEDEDVSGNESFEPNYQSDEDYLEHVQSEIRADSSADYSSHFENIESLFKFQIAVIIGLLLCVCFIVGWKRE